MGPAGGGLEVYAGLLFHCPVAAGLLGNPSPARDDSMAFIKDRQAVRSRAAAYEMPPEMAKVSLPISSRPGMRQRPEGSWQAAPG